MSEEKKKRRLRDITFEKAGNHIALVSPVLNGGPANQVETILWKSKATNDITEEDVKQLLEKASGKTEVEKARWNSEVNIALNALVRDKYKTDDGWLYLEDFSPTTLVVNRDGNLFAVGYTLSDSGEYELSGEEYEVEVRRIFVEKGVAKLSPELEKELDEGVYSLLSKALDNPETNKRVVQHVSDTLEKAQVKMQEEIQKAVAAANAASAEKLAAVQAELTKATEALAAVEAEKKVTVMKSRQETVAKFDKEGAEALVKATEALDDAAFATLVKSLGVGHAAVVESDLFKQKSTQGAEATAPESVTVTMLKAASGK